MADQQDVKNNSSFEKKDGNVQSWSRDPADLQDLTQHVSVCFLLKQAHGRVVVVVVGRCVHFCIYC